MSITLDNALDYLKSIITTDEAKRFDLQTLPADFLKHINAHIHLPPNFSAFESVQQMITLAKSQSVSLVGTSNYYDYDVYGDFFQLAKKNNIFPLFGLETIVLIDELVSKKNRVNDPGNPGKMYACGKGLSRLGSRMTPEGKKLLSTIRTNDQKRMKTMIEKLDNIFSEHGVNTELSEEAVIDAIVKRHNCPKETVTLQERHVAKVFQERFFDCVHQENRIDVFSRIIATPSKAGSDPVKYQNEIRSHLMKTGKPAYVEETFLGFDDGVKLILELGGIPCYPILADGANPICEFETPVETLIENIKKFNFHFAEFIPIRNKTETLDSYVKAIRQAGIVVSAGTEHNTLDVIPIEPSCLNDKPIPEDLKDIFREGACVAVGHQFMTLNGECGFVDSNGNPNSNYSSAEKRIDAFHRIGAAVIKKYFERN